MKELAFRKTVQMEHLPPCLSEKVSDLQNHQKQHFLKGGKFTEKGKEEIFCVPRLLMAIAFGC